MQKLKSHWGFWQDHWDHVEGIKVQSLTDLGVVTTTSEFWTLLERHPTNQLSKDCSLHIFRGNIKPEWEDPHNVNGGHFRLLPNVNTDVNVQQKRIGHLWFDLVSAVVGEHFDDASSVAGIAFTNKSYRQVISVWTTTIAPAVVASVQHNLLQHAQDNFSIKFVPHKRIARSDFTTQQTRLHRRTKSAPFKFVTVVSEDDEEAAIGGQGEENVKTEMELSKPSLLSRRGVPQSPLTSEGIRLNTTSTPPPAAPSSTVKFAPDVVSGSSQIHHRSKSEGEAKNVLPGNTISSRQSSELHYQQSGEQGGCDLKGSDSGPLFATPSIAAPSPMKDWSVGWSPSLLQINATNTVQSKFPVGMGGSQPPPPAPAPALVPTPAPASCMPFGNNMNQGQPPKAYSHNPHATAPPPGAPFNSDRIIIGTVKPPPKKKVAEKPEVEQPPAPAPASVPVKSDSAPFVSRGWLYPGGMNRKERRKIIFQVDAIDPTTVEGAIFVGEEVPDGAIENPQEYQQMVDKHSTKKE